MPAPAPLLRPSVAIALAVTAVTSQGCLFFLTGGCGDLTIEETPIGVYADLNEDGLVELYDGTTADPETADGCETICREYSYMATIDTVHDCSVLEYYQDTTDTGAYSSAVDIECTVTGEEQCMGGRHSAALAHRARGAGRDSVSAWLAREACAEAGSVLAFARLAAELSAHGAPADLIAQARAAEQDEVRHARMVRRLAEARGGLPAEPVAAPDPGPRSLLDVALENAVEGCVHETFAAARARWQAQHAEDAEVGAVSRLLAEDEGRHADLAAAVHAWALAVLPPAQAAQVEAARQAAWTRLAWSPPAADAQTTARLGLPSPAAHRQLAQALSQALAA